MSVAQLMPHTSVPRVRALIADALSTLNGARSAADVLDARDKAAFAYDEAKRAARLAKARSAHDEVVSAIHRAQAQALEIEAAAKRRLADEYDAAQSRGEVANQGRRANIPKKNVCTVADIGLSPKQIYEAREIRDAEEAEPGIVRRALDDAIASGEEPTKAKVRRVIRAKSRRKKTDIRRRTRPSVTIEGGEPYDEPAHSLP